MNPDRYHMLRAQAAAQLAATDTAWRDTLALEALLARAVLADTLRDAEHRDRVWSVLESLAPSFTRQVRRVLSVSDHSQSSNERYSA